VVANCPVVDWTILGGEQRRDFESELRGVYSGGVWRGIPAVGEELGEAEDGKFYSPLFHAKEIDAAKVTMFHAEMILMCRTGQCRNLRGSRERGWSCLSAAGI